MKSAIRLNAVLLPILVTLAILPAAYAGEGGHNGGGGDNCEDRFKVIARDLRSWIVKGGSKSLDLSVNGPQIGSKEYSDLMIDQIDNARITCVSKGDPDYPVLVNNKPKECRAETDASGIRRIICDRAKFYSEIPNRDDSPGQYRIVHHEYATLAGLEVANEDDSDYHLSDQITDFLELQVVKRLAVRPVKNPGIVSTDKLITVFLTPGYIPRRVVARVYARSEILHDPLCSDPSVTRVTDSLVKRGNAYIEAHCTDEGLQLFKFIQCEGERDEKCQELGRGSRTFFEIEKALGSVRWLKPSDAILFTSWADALPHTRGFSSDYGAQLLDLLKNKSDVSEIVVTAGPNNLRIFEQLMYYSHDSRCAKFGVFESCSWGQPRK